MTNEEKSDFLWNVHKYTNEYIRFADTKAAFVAGLDAALIGATVSTSIFDSCLRRSVCHWSVMQVLSVGGVIALSVSICLCVSVIIPRLWHNAARGLIYWDSVVAHGSPRNFINSFSHLSTSDLNAEVANHIYVLAGIAKRKYEFMRSAIMCSIVGGTITGLSIWLQHALK